LFLAAALAPLSGCSSGGNALFPKTYRLLPAARDVAAASRPTDPRELSKQALEAYFVQPGDVLLIEVTDLEADIRLPADQTVMPDGTIDLAQYGRVVVAGLTIEQIEALVTSTVQAGEKDAVVKPINVRLNVAESATYYVLGEVNSPGAYPLIGRETVLDAIQTAGGLSDRASDCQIILSRPTPPNSCRIVLPVCYDRIVQLGDTTTNYQIRPGDRVFVATRTLCEAIKFWQRDCPNCPDCGSWPCRCGVTPAQSPYVTPGFLVNPAEPVPLPTPAPEMIPATPSLEPEPEAAAKPAAPNVPKVANAILTIPTPPIPPAAAAVKPMLVKPVLSSPATRGRRNPFLDR
jgi:protein involved in polysaccharide export with SLBB domain